MIVDLKIINPKIQIIECVCDPAKFLFVNTSTKANTLKSFVMETLAREISTQQTPSVQYFIFDQHKIIDSYCAGLASVERQIEVNAATTYHAFSLTKTFTALAILQLAEQNKLDIDHPVVHYLPSFYFGPDISIRHLLNHTAGISNPIPISWIHLLEEHAEFDRDKYFEPIMAKNRRVKSKPNELFSYTNLGYIALGQLIEKVSGQAYEGYVSELIIAKLGLADEDLGFTIAEFVFCPVFRVKTWNYFIV